MRPLSRLLAFSLLSALCVVLLPASGFADTISHTASLPLGTTNWSGTMSIPKFDGTPECLQSVCFQLSGHVEGAAKFESLDAGPATVNMNLQATITLQRPNGSTLVTVIPLANTVDNVTAFDDSIDFGGTSGKTYNGLSGDKVESACTMTGDDMALFSGTGNIDLPVVALGTSNGSGAGNLILQFNTTASSAVTVTYTYHCLVPSEETTWGKIKNLYN